MNLHEFQAKDILAGYGLSVPAGAVAESADDAVAAARKIAAARFAVKAQVHAGGRGRAGGVRMVESYDAVRAAAEELLGTRLVTEQTGAAGRAVRKVYVEAAVEAEHVLYVAVLVNRDQGAVSLIGAKAGGEDIEERAARNPGIIEELLLAPDGTARAADFNAFARRLGLKGDLAKEAGTLFKSLTRAFVELDASLIEINPLAVMAGDDLLALDVKMVLDDNALFRHGELDGLRDVDELDPVELKAQESEINYVQMDGDIGVVVNGAGLALATLDLLRDAGGAPANFMDIRTTATSLDIARGFDLLLENDTVRAVLVNVHGGGLQRCDTVAEGIGIAMKRSGRARPIVLRFAGNNADFGRTLLDNYGVAYTQAADMADAVDRVTALVRQEAA
ncbi:MAG: ADP-forming succinate--CoA ligase subunit beta [Hyphomicrobiales bacterium]|nr:ADP-forming succinate--CoA ligase subunit beta [Hyphomicrobiales bacterium]